MSLFDIIREKANLVRTIDLVLVLELAGGIQDKLDKAKWHTQQGTISVCGAKFINWTQGTGGGGAIDLIMHLKDIDFKSAVFWLAAAFPSYDIHRPFAMKSQSKPILQLPKKDNTKVSQIVDYLMNARSIPHPLIISLIDSGRLYADSKANAVFLLLGKEKRVVGAELRGTTHTRWHGMATGTRKDHGFFWVKIAQSIKIVLVESAIDAISFLALYPDCLAISTSGATPNPAWLRYFIDLGYEIYCGFDSDETGDKIAQKMIILYPTIKRLRPQKHDWNEVLKAKSKE